MSETTGKGKMAWAKDALHRAKLTQRHLAREWRVSESAVSRWLDGMVPDPPVSRVVKFANLVKMDIHEVVTHLDLLLAPGTIPAAASRDMNSPMNGFVGSETQLTVLERKPGYAILQLKKLCMPVQTALKILELAYDAQPCTTAQPLSTKSEA